MSATSIPETPAAPGHIRIDNRIITDYAASIGAHALAVYLVLAFHAGARTRQCYPSTRTISRLLKLSRPTVLKAICKLEEEGLIKVERRRTKNGCRAVNVYTLLPVGGGQPVLPPVVNDVDHRGQGALPEQDLINKTQKNKTARAAAQVQAKDSNLDHPAVLAYREICKLTPNETQRAAIASAVTDIPKWREVIQRWLLKDYRKSNVDGMLDWYRQGIPEGRGGNGKNGRITDARSGRVGFQGDWAGERRERRPPDTPEDIARRDAEWQKLVRESQTRS